MSLPSRQAGGTRAWGGQEGSPHGALRLTNRTVWVLAAIGDHPGSSSRKIAIEAGIKDEGQASKLLGRLASHGLIQNTIQPKGRGEAYAWYLTEKGREIVRDVRAGEAVKARRVRTKGRGMGTHAT
jgi:DNA-binding MarR family transcriptional regulator